MMKGPSVEMVRITDSRFLPVARGLEVWTTLEGGNPGGSIKDHMVYGELSELLRSKTLHAGEQIAEISAGSTAQSLAYYCRQFELKCTLFVPRSLPRSSCDRLEELGASLIKLDPTGAYEKYNQFIRETGIRKFDQFGNPHLRRHYEAIGSRVVSRCRFSAVIGSVGTGHSLMGISQGVRISQRFPLQVVSAEPEKPGQVSGVRNLRLESFGDQDPCRDAQFDRIELCESAFFPDGKIETDQGWMQGSDSFRLVLGAVERFLESHGEASVFAVGANNRLCES